MNCLLTYSETEINDYTIVAGKAYEGYEDAYHYFVSVYDEDYNRIENLETELKSFEDMNNRYDYILSLAKENRL